MSCTQYMIDLYKTNQSPLKFLLNQFLIIHRGFFPTWKIMRKIKKTQPHDTCKNFFPFGRLSAPLEYTNDLPTL